MPKVNVKVPKRSGFNKSHSNLLTTKCGTLVPILCDELIPNSKVYLKDLISAQLPPLATDTFMRVNLKVEAFFVPTRLLYAGFEKWLVKDTLTDPINDTEKSVRIPVAAIPASANLQGTLADYLGIRSVAAGDPNTYLPVNIFPFLAYHKCWSDWYRNTLCQRDCFSNINNWGVSGDRPRLWNLPYQIIDSGLAANAHQFALSATFADGVQLNALRQRNFGFDYFTGALPNAQLGDPQRVSIETSGSNANTFTIASLRAANSLQQFAERNQMAGLRLQDYVKANYGADLSSGVAQRSIYLGSAEIPVYSKGVYQTEPQFDDESNNPMGSVASKYGDAMANGEITLVKDFVANEPGYLMVMASLVPVAVYASGIDRMFNRYNTNDSQTDMATPLLQNVGNQPIYRSELTGTRDSSVFGYTDRYADFKQKQSSIHGLLREGQSLGNFALQRVVTGSVNISSEFLEIPDTYMDSVCATQSSISEYGVWINVYHDYKVSMPLAEYSIPSLQDPAYEHGDDVQINIGGSRL